MSSLDGDDLYLLAFDHRASLLSGLLGVDGEPADSERTQAASLKYLIYQGFLEGARRAGVPDSCGVLVDEQLGADVARQAKASGFRLAMSVEKSGQAEFDFEYGADFAAHITAFDPDFCKVLVRYNPEGDAATNSRQAARLATLSRWCRDHGRLLLFELLVPPTDAQKSAAGGDERTYERQQLPGLTVAAIAALQDADVEPEVWKIQGMDRRADDAKASPQARTDGRGGTECIVLGHGEDAARVSHWLAEAAATDGYHGFAIGRTIWWQPLADHLAGALSPEHAIGRIGANYVRMIDTYRQAGRATAGRQGDRQRSKTSPAPAEAEP